MNCKMPSTRQDGTTPRSHLLGGGQIPLSPPVEQLPEFPPLGAIEPLDQLLVPHREVVAADEFGAHAARHI